MHDDPDVDAAQDETTAGQINESLDRLVFFCDAVIAIALTLLALDLRTPEGDTDAELWRSFAGLFWGNYFPYLLSFLVIAIFWSSHRRIFLHIERAGRWLVFVSMVFLFAIVTMPFATRLLAESDSQVATVLYATDVAVCAVSLIATIQLAWRQRWQRAGAPESARVGMSYALGATAASFLISIPIAFVDTSIAKYSWLVLSLVLHRAADLIHRRQER